jgi:hypothetical protein
MTVLWPNRSSGGKWLPVMISMRSCRPWATKPMPMVRTSDMATCTFGSTAPTHCRALTGCYDASSSHRRQDGVTPRRSSHRMEALRLSLRRFLDSFLQQCLTVIIGPRRAAEHSWHACRATLASSLGVNKETGEIIQVMCRWKAAESVREYNHITPDVYADKVAAAMAVDASQAPKGQRQVVTDDDEAMAVLQAEMEDLSATGATVDTLRATRATAGHGAQATKEAPAGVYRKLEKAPAKNAIVLVPASTWPIYACNENDGQGWLAKVVSSHGAAVRVCCEMVGSVHQSPFMNHAMFASVAYRSSGWAVLIEHLRRPVLRQVT